MVKRKKFMFFRNQNYATVNHKDPNSILAQLQLKTNINKQFKLKMNTTASTLN